MWRNRINPRIVVWGLALIVAAIFLALALNEEG